MRDRLPATKRLQPNERVGRWTIIAVAQGQKIELSRFRPRWLCRCECGSEKAVLAQSLALALRSTRGGSRSCGCLAIERSTRHAHAAGAGPTPEYSAWLSAKKRCENPSNASFYNYGARGISMCADWARDFRAFLRDMGPRPSPAHSLDRIDPDGAYAPGNCRWAPPEVQARNRRVTRWYLFEGEQLVLGQVASRLGITRDRARALEHRRELPAWQIPGGGANRLHGAPGYVLDLNEASTTGGGAAR